MRSTPVVVVAFLALAQAACFQSKVLPSKLVPDARTVDADSCFDRCVGWTAPGSHDRQSCVLACPGIQVLAGGCGAEPRCVDFSRTKLTYDAEATAEAVRATVVVVEVVAEVAAEHEARKEKKKKHEKKKGR